MIRVRSAPVNSQAVRQAASGASGAFDKKEDMAMHSAFMKERDAMHQRFRSLMPATAGILDDLMSITYRDGALSAETKELIALGISVAMRCEPCMRYHVERARAKGSTDEKLLEAMGVGLGMGVGQLMPPLRSVLGSQFEAAGERPRGAGVAPDPDRSHAGTMEAAGEPREEFRHGMWTQY